MALFCEQSEILNKKLLIKNSHLAFIFFFTFDSAKFYNLFYTISDLFFSSYTVWFFTSQYQKIWGKLIQKCHAFDFD
jgi:hypothetical protein